MDNRAAFARARKFLNYNPVAKWAALAAAVASGLLYVGLLFLLGLFADLMVNQGQIPAYHDLTLEQQEDFLGDWGGLSPEEQRDLLRQASPDAGSFGTAGGAGILAPLQPERLWQAHVYEILRDYVNGDAAQEYLEDTPLTGPQNPEEREQASLGVLSLVVRSNSLTVALVGWLASWNPWMWTAGNYGYLAGLLLVGILLVVLRAALMFTSEYMAARATIEAATRLRRAIYHHTFRLGTLAFRALGPSEAVSVFTRHLEAIHDALHSWLTLVFREPVKFSLVLLFALLVKFWLALAFLVLAILVWFAGGQIAAYFRRQGRVAEMRAADQLALIQESLKMMRLVKVYLMEVFNQARVERQLARYSRAQLATLRGEAIYRPLFILLGVLAVMGLMTLGGLAILSGRLGVASAVTLATALVSLFWPLREWLENRRILRRGRESAAVLFKFLDRSGAVGQVVGAEFLPPMSRQLEFDEVSLQEPGAGQRLLHGVSFTVQAGQRVAFVGPDDMEKHALVYLIPRFLDPNAGEIRIDNKNLRWVTFDSLRAQVAVVLQHDLVFNDTVAHNIGCGDPSYTMPQIIEAAKMAHAHQFIQKLPQGYETPIGEMGHSLKTGEKFRVALARAILRDPALLIVEETLTPLDDDTKALVDDTFARFLPGRTTIFLPHRLSTIRSCERVFLVHQGKIEAVGEHRELLAHSELYRHLQYLEFNEFAGKVEAPTST